MVTSLLVAYLLFTLSANGSAEPALMSVEVQLDGTTLFKTNFLFRYVRQGTTTDEPQETLTFSFKPERQIVWMRGSGVLVTPAKTKPNQLIEGSIQIWPAEAGSNWLTIGVSFHSDDRLLINASHIVHEKKRERSAVATTGVLVLTYPARGNAKKTN